MLTSKKGDIGLAQAIAAFTRNGFNVSIPISESLGYDLIVEQEGEKPVLATKKGSQSQVWRFKVKEYNDTDGFYKKIMAKMIDNSEEILEFLETL